MQKTGLVLVFFSMRSKSEKSLVATVTLFASELVQQFQKIWMDVNKINVSVNINYNLWHASIEAACHLRR